MAIGFEKPDGQRRIRFSANVSHGGIDYGPDYPEQECTMDARSAANYVREGRAQYVGDSTPPEKETLEELPATPGKARKGK
jgi:hypothetical protein